ncbi:MAG: hypothetical protein EPN22_09070 [Nitrospirae bacterium]|nr:MAG: hypothetical protein EPN22_09070 [Nitrospirota bacterium]
MKRWMTAFSVCMVFFASAAFGGIVVEDKQGMKMEVAGNQLFLNKANGRIPAPDGKFFLRDGSFIIVVNGRIDPAKSSALQGHSDIAAEVRGERQSSKKPQDPMTIRGFNPQPEPPGKEVIPQQGGMNSR